MGAILIALLIPVIAVFLLRIPSVKNYATREATTYTSELIGYPVTIGNIEIDWYDHIILQNVVLKDREQNDMIFLGEGVIDFSFYKLMRGTFQIEDCVVRDGGVNLYVFEQDTIVNINEFMNTLQAKFGDPLDTSTAAPFVFTIPYAKLKNMSFRFMDETELVVKPGFDEMHFGFDSVYSYVEQFEIRSDTIQLTTHKLRAVEFRSKMHIHELNTFFRFHETGMHFEHAYAHVGNSTINADVHFAYDSISVLTEFNTQVQMKGSLDNCHLKVQDLAIFSPMLYAYHDNYIISGDISGTVNRLKGKNLELCFGKNSFFRGTANLKNLPSIDDLFLDCSAKAVLIDIPDLKQYVETDIYNDIIKLRYFEGKGKFVGFFHDFTTQGIYQTGLGKIEADLFLNRPEIGERNPIIKLSGRLETYHFRIGELIGHPAAESISIKGEMIGEGKNILSASVNIVYAVYNYKNITTKADLSNRLFKGFAAIKDSNLVASVDGTIDFREEWKIFNFKLICDKANLHNMNLGSASKFPSLRTSAFLNARVLNINELEGNLHTGQTYLLYPNNKEVFIDSIHAEVYKQDNNERVFTLQSDLIDGNIKGDFDFIGLEQSLVMLGEEALLKINNDEAETNRYYANKTSIGKQQQADFHFEIKDLNQIFDIYLPGTFMSPNSTLQGKYTSTEEQNNLSLNFISDTLFYNFYEFRGNNVSGTISKRPYSPHLTTTYDLASASQKFKRMVPTKNLSIKGHTENDSLFISSSLEQDGMNNKIVLNNKALFLKDKTEITSENSYVQIDDEQWDINPKAKISLMPDGSILLNELNMQYLNQHLNIDGWISDNKDQKLNININNFNINTILTFLTTIPINGLINGDIILSNILDSPDFYSDIEVYDLEIDSVAVGDMEGNSFYNTQKKKIEIDFDLYKDYSTIATVTGLLNPGISDTGDDIDLTVDMTKTDLTFLNPLLEGILENIQGEASGVVKITGPYNDPDINGETYVEKGRFKIPYLGTTYSLNDKIIFNDNLIGFKNVNLKDQFGETCVLNGGIYHDLFQNFVFNLKGEMNNFFVLNTTEKDNSIFYGRAFGTGSWEFLGSENDIRITADATLLRSSKIYIPMNSYEDVEEKDYITFVKHEDKDKLQEKKINLSGILMDLNVNIEPGTYTEIIFDKQAGDIIKSYGRGSLKFNVDTRGDFSMYGNYIIEKGSYNFTLANIINKEFKIVNGSRISWTGNPYDGILNIDAAYQQYVPLAPIITSSDTLVRNSADAKRRTPVDLDMKLTGQLLHPEVELGIHILNKYPSSLSSYVTAFENQLQTNPSELNRQVFSLLLFRQFSPPNEFTGVGGATQNLNELLSNQLSMWLSQVDPNLQIQVDLTQLSQASGGNNNFNMRFSYTLLDGRLRVSMDGLVAGSQNNKNTGSQNSSNSNVIGEWTLEYFLTQDGKLRLKLFNRANQNSVISSTSSNVSNSTGFSVTHTQEFDNLGELFGRSNKKEKKQNLKNQMIIKKDDDALPVDTVIVEPPLIMPEDPPQLLPKKTP
ncbi:MAG: hypothetical protein K0R51_173 [Cytophagaceae bacterium]|nr:hypothetical protein [Cytophagaceae bacterium]